MKLSLPTAPVWINANPSFKYFDDRIIRYLSCQVPIAYWEYHQTWDEASSMEIALILLHDYLKSRSQPVDLIGHGTGGLLGLLYARQYPQRVKSLTLLGVGYNPAIDWQAHYYQMRQLLPCSQERLLVRMVRMMFGHQDNRNTRELIKILQRDLYTAPTAHSLYRLARVEPGGVSMPMMVCGSNNDGIVERPALDGWQDYLKENDLLWTHPWGHHFCHYFFPQETGRQVIKFWRQVHKKQIVPSKSLALEKTCYSL
ncbi:alpha/beta fold hydrolase [Pleurocapsales cyanobacterium LEGE 10410]|nr:alpha/beta fold hydrolase [Pleurocapsales cyanobacterium LEGE 10410]